MVVVLAQQLGVHLAHAVDGPRPLHRHVGRRVTRRVRPEGADGGRHEQAQLVLLGQLDHVVNAFDVDSDGQGHVLLAHGAEKRAEVDEPVDAVAHDDLLQPLEVQDVGEDVGPLGRRRLGGLDDVGHEHVLLAVHLAEEAGHLEA